MDNEPDWTDLAAFAIGLASISAEVALVAILAFRMALG